MKLKWLTTRSAYLAIVSILGAASIAAFWLPSEHRLRAGTVLLGFVVTRYVAMWLHQYAILFASPKKGLSKTEAAERRLIWLFECQMDDPNAMGSSHKPIHIKLDDIDLRRIGPDG